MHCLEMIVAIYVASFVRAFIRSAPSVDAVSRMCIAFSEAHRFARTSIISPRTTSERLNPELDGPNLTRTYFYNASGRLFDRGRNYELD